MVIYSHSEWFEEKTRGYIVLVITECWSVLARLSSTTGTYRIYYFWNPENLSLSPANYTLSFHSSSNCVVNIDRMCHLELNIIKD